MAVDRVARVVMAYEAGALTEGAACVEVFLAAGEGDAGEVWAGLSPGLREVVGRRVAGVGREEVWIVESHCGDESAEAYAEGVRRREEVARRGMVALRRVIGGSGHGG